MIRIVEYISLFTFLGSVALGLTDDPQFLLPKIDSFVNGQAFELAFAPSQEIKFETLECVGSWGCSAPIRMSAKVEIVNEGEVFINQYGANNQLKARNKVERTQWEAINRNYLRAKLNSIESFGFKVTLNEFSEITCPVREFVTAQDQCSKMKAVAINSLGHRSDYSFILWRSPTALGQILESVQTDSKPLVRTIKYQLTAFRHD
jgi:hypothetical protein